MGKVNIEVMIDTNANSRKIDGMFHELRNGLGQNAAQASENSAGRALKEFRAYVEDVRKLTGVEYVVTQRDTAQIFHEKTNTLTPELAKKARIEIRPDFIRENLEDGFYHVEPPIHGEEIYYEALRKMVYMIQEDKEPGQLKREGITKPEDIAPLKLQGMYREHMMNLQESSKYRSKPPFEAEFKRYHKIRFNQGEETAIQFLKTHDLPPAGERTAFVFVGSDNYANKSMASARDGQEKQDAGRFETYVTGPKQFVQMLEQVVRDIERSHPQTRSLRANLRELHPVEETASRRFARREDPQVRSFADFVSRGRETTNGVER